MGVHMNGTQTQVRPGTPTDLLPASVFASVEDVFELQKNGAGLLPCERLRELYRLATRQGGPVNLILCADAEATRPQEEAGLFVRLLVVPDTEQVGFGYERREGRHICVSTTGYAWCLVRRFDRSTFFLALQA